jgi:hypothetical protein
MQPYAPRAFRFIDVWEIPNWRMKVYGIACRGELPRAELISAAKKIVREQLAKEAGNNYGVGFVGVHDGRDAAFVFVDFWGNENELFHRVFLSRENNWEKLAPADENDPSVCVWDLQLQTFERDAWIKHVLRKPDAPDFDGYLSERLSADL